MTDPFALRGVARITKKGAGRLDAGHAWVYASDVADNPPEAGVVMVEGPGGYIVGTALLSPASTIRLRLLGRGKRAFDRAELFARLERALERRRRQMPGVDAWRWVHGEGDLLPSLFVDRYGDCISLQALSGGADVLVPTIVECIRELASPRAIVVRNDATARQREGLPQAPLVALGEGPIVARYHEGPLELEVDLVNDQKTGGFLDQAANHQAAARFASGRGLDCFTYHGGFALQLARVCSHVTAVDISAPALERAAANGRRAGLSNLSFERADVLDLLPAWVKEGRSFDTIVVDPPAFASGKASEEGARRAYKEVNLRAMKLLNPGGVLVSCSCSGRITPDVFDEILADAARDARRPVQLLERRGAGVDHPVLLGVPETEYLKCRILQVL